MIIMKNMPPGGKDLPDGNYLAILALSVNKLHVVEVFSGMENFLYMPENCDMNSRSA